MYARFYFQSLNKPNFKCTKNIKKILIFFSVSTELYLPKEIPLESYAPPPATNIARPSHTSAYESQPIWSPPVENSNSYKNQYPRQNNNTYLESNQDAMRQQPYSPPKQQQWAPNSYQTVPQDNSNTVPHVNFSPSPIPYDKLAKFENTNNLSTPYQSTKIRNTSPAPFGISNSRNSGNAFIPKPVSNVPNVQKYSHDFNNYARGWQQTAAPIKSNLHNIRVSDDVPYTDF